MYLSNKLKFAPADESNSQHFTGTNFRL